MKSLVGRRGPVAAAAMDMARSLRVPLALLAVAAALLGAAQAAHAASFGSRVLSQGMSGPDVATLQRILTRLGLRTGADGQFGPATAARVRTYERRVHGLVDGKVSRGQAGQMKARVAGLARPQMRTRSADSGAQRHVFPVRGAHTFGEGAARFGAGRSGHVHQGQDVFARSGTTVAAAQAGRVHYVGSQAGGAGNYLVIFGEDGTDSVYMHLLERPSVSVGQHVDAGDPIGHVGCTGSCSGPHLHFELWTAHWYAGGRAFDPLPKLRQWDAVS